MNLSLDLRHNLRLLRKNFGFVALCVLVIGLGMGLSITMYTMITDFGYNTPSYPDGDRYVVVSRVDRDTGAVSFPDSFDGYTFKALQTSAKSYQSLGASRHNNVTFSDGDIAAQFFATYITPNLLQITAVEPHLGRNLLPADDIPGAEPVVLISYRLWQNYYGGREDIIGVSSRINSSPHIIVGVMPEGFNYPLTGELWLPLQLPDNALPGDKTLVRIEGVLTDGTAMESASAEANSLMLQLGQRLPEFYGNQDAMVISHAEGYSPGMTFIHILTGLTGTLLLFVCLNVANLLVVRSNERLPELAIRNALGATPWRLIQSVLLDSALICVLGALLGLILADLGMEFIRSTIEGMNSIPLPSWLKLDWEFNTGIAALLVILLIWLFSGGVAAWRVSRNDISGVLGESTTGSVDSGGAAANAALVGFEITFSCFLLVLSGAFIGTAYDLTKVDYGTATEGYLTGGINLPTLIYTDADSQNLYRQNLAAQLLEQNRIAEVTFTSALPSIQGVLSSYNLEDRNLLTDNGYPSQEIIQVAQNYFDTMEIRIRAGRVFDSSDSANSLPVVIIDELFAAQVWPGESAIGKRIQLGPELDSPEWLTVVGVTSHVIQRWSLRGTNEPSLYRPFSQNSGENFFVVVKVTGISESDVNAYHRTLQEVAMEIDRDVPITEVFLLTEVLKASNTFIDMTKNIFSNIAFITLVLAVTGIYAVVSRSVWQRKKEIGIRRALGSSNAKVLWVFFRQGFKYLILGLVIGGGGAILITNATASGMFGVFGMSGMTNWLPLVSISVSLGLFVLILIAVYNPAHKLVALEPGQALHYD